MTVRLYLDANLLVYAFERTGTTSEPRGVLGLVRDGVATAVISELVVAELLVRPLMLGDKELTETYLNLLEAPIGYETYPVDRDVLIEAARRRASRPQIRLPDAIHVATACLRRCHAIVTNDRRISPPDELLALSLDASIVDNIRALA
jgi:predicted nucleic acid-binding protein